MRRFLCMTELTSPKIEPHEIVGEIIDACGWLAEGESTADEFRRTVVAFEARKLARFGYQLSSAVGADGKVQFSLRHAATGELCASLEVDSTTGGMIVQQAWL